MKTLTLCLMLIAICFPAFAQNDRNDTHLAEGSGGILIIFNDINTNPERLTWVRSLIENENAFGTIVIMRTTNTIPRGAFAHSNTEYVNFQPTSRISVIPEEAFIENHHLKQIHLPQSVVTIEIDAFGYCSNLAEVKFGDSDDPSRLETIAEGAFFGTNISRIYIPDSVRTIGHDILPETIQSIRLPANVSMGSGNPFHQIYVQNGRRAGVYISREGRWRYTNDVTEEEFARDGWSFVQ
ncbi:MAG: leucine-rich repeat domain-containing protein [Treponema sp.]|nr:leucine-rich repeat domain-containing protein [Treponema sp.]